MLESKVEARSLYFVRERLFFFLDIPGVGLASRFYLESALAGLACAVNFSCMFSGVVLKCNNLAAVFASRDAVYNVPNVLPHLLFTHLFL